MQAATKTEPKMKTHRHSLFKSVFVRLVLGFAIIYCYSEYATHYVTQMQCWWPELKNKPADGVIPVHAMVLADIHLQGSLSGHWFDKWRREFQMHRSFQTAMTLHKPEVVFVLGDLFDEGKWCSQSEFAEYVNRFHSLFKVPAGTKMYTVVGNHDIGFHYSKELERRLKMAGVTIGGDDYHRITARVTNRFEYKLNSSIVQMISIRGNHFVLINSMAMQGDGCSLCSRAMAKLKDIKEVLQCSKGFCKGDTEIFPYSRPILMQASTFEPFLPYKAEKKKIVIKHFPLYRHSDNICTDPDSAPLPQRNRVFMEHWDCLSEESTQYLVKNLDPRAAFDGHTHHSCTVEHTFEQAKEQKIQLTEYTVPSFNWRNRLDPKYYLVTITPDEIQVNKCDMITEKMLLTNAVLLCAVMLLYLWFYIRAKNVIHYKNLSAKQI